MTRDLDQTISSEAYLKTKLQPEQMREIIKKIELSGVLGRSKLYSDLLYYLCNAYDEGSTPKEIIIAIDVMGKDSEFDVKNDSLVRVYMHKLRQKLTDYYREQGQSDAYQISIPKGQYSLFVEQPHPANTNVAEEAEHSNEPEQARKSLSPLTLLLLISAVLLAANIVYPLLDIGNKDNASLKALTSLGKHPAWAPLLDDKEPIVLVIGDFFLADKQSNNANRASSEENSNALASPDMRNNAAKLSSHHQKPNVSYLPRSTAFVMKDILPILTAAGKSVSIRMSSQIKGSDLKSQHILYIGHISAMGELQSFAFQQSAFAIGQSAEELVHVPTGETHTSGELDAIEHGDSFYDYGMFSTMPMLDGHQMMFISGTQDTGIMHMAHILSDIHYLDTMTSSLKLESDSPEPLSFEAIYRVIGYDGLNFDADKIYVGPLDYKLIWGGEMMNVMK